MQDDTYKNEFFIKILGETVRELRENKHFSGREFAYEYDISRGNLNKIENGKIECKITTIWKISQALGLKFSEFSKILEEKLGEDFSFID